jgi:hypothetical protein
MNAPGNHDVVVPCHHAGRGEMYGLLARPALAVHGHARDGLGPAGRQHRGTGDVDGLLTGLADTAPDDVFDDSGVDAGPVDQAVEYLRGQFGRVHPGQSAIALPDRCANCLDDDGFSHGDVSFERWTWDEVLLSRLSTNASGGPRAGWFCARLPALTVCHHAPLTNLNFVLQGGRAWR